MRNRRAWAAAAAQLAAAALWSCAAQALWSSTDPGPAFLPQVEASRFFGESFLTRSAGYGRFLAVDGLLATLALLAVLVVYARRGHRLMRESAAGRVGTGILLGMLGFAIVWLVEVPFGLAAVWWQRRHGVSDQDYLSWLANSFVSLGSKFLFVSVALALAMGLAGVLRRSWWAVATPIFAALALLFVFLSPYLIPETGKLERPELVADARQLEGEQGLSGTRLEVQDVHRFTTAPNAEATGLGPTGTVILWDTLLDGRFDDAELRVILAHEFGHLAHDDILKGVGWMVLFLIPATALIALSTRRRGGLSRPEAVPVALLVLVALQLLATPLFNVVTRRQEAAADWAALETTRDPAADRELLRHLATASLSDPDPPTWAYVLYENHPTIVQRLAMADAWERSRGSGAASP